MVWLKSTPARLVERRGTLAIINACAAAAFSTQAVIGTEQHHSRDGFYFLLWLVWRAVTLIWVFGTPGYLRWSAAQRAVINDELVRAHQAASAKAGFAIALVGLGTLSTCVFFQIASPALALPMLTSAAVVGAALTFGCLERRDA